MQSVKIKSPKFDFKWREKAILAFFSAVILIIIISGISQGLLETRERDYVCMNSVQYDIRNNNEFHIRLEKGKALACKELDVDPLGDH
jgi:hypothetical protein